MIRIDTPLLVGSADEVDPQPGQDIGRVVERLREVLDAAPDQNVQWAWIVAAGTLHDPLGPIGGLAHARVSRYRDRPLTGDVAQSIGGWIAGRMASQRRVVLPVEIDDVEDVLDAAVPVRGGDEALQIETVRADQQMHHRLKVIRVGTADIGGDDHAVALRPGTRYRGRTGAQRAAEN